METFGICLLFYAVPLLFAASAQSERTIKPNLHLTSKSPKISIPRHRGGKKTIPLTLSAAVTIAPEQAAVGKGLNEVQSFVKEKLESRDFNSLVQLLQLMKQKEKAAYMKRCFDLFKSQSICHQTTPFFIWQQIEAKRLLFAHAKTFSKRGIPS